MVGVGGRIIDMAGIHSIRHVIDGFEIGIPDGLSGSAAGIPDIGSVVLFLYKKPNVKKVGDNRSALKSTNFL